MRIKIGMYEIEVDAKTEYEDEYNRDSTMSFLNWLSIILYESSERYYQLGIDIRGLEGLGNERKKTGDNIRNYLWKKGFYK